MKTMRSRLLVALLLACAAGAGAETVFEARGTLDSNDSQWADGRHVDWNKVPLTSGTRYVFGARSDDIDLALLLRFSDGALLSSNGFAGSDPAIVYTAVRSETVEVGVTNALDPETGKYTVAVERVAAGKAVQAGQKISRVTGLDTADSRGWRSDSLMLVGGRGDRVTIRLTSPEFAPVLRVQTRGGYADELVETGAGDPAALSYVFLQQGQAEIVVRASDPGRGGKYDLEIERQPPARVLQGKGVLEGKLAAGADFCLLEGKKGQAFAVGVESDDFDPMLEVIDHYGRRAINDDHGEDKASRVVHVFADDQPVGIAVRRVEDGESGSYRLTVEPADMPSAQAEDLAELSDGDEIEAFLDVTSLTRGSKYVHRYTFHAEVEQVVRLELTSPDFDAYLEVVAPDGSLTSDDDGLENYGSAVDMICRDEGTYTVRVTTAGEWQSGSYRLAFADKGGAEALLETEGRLEHKDARDISGRYYDTYVMDVEEDMSLSIVMTSEEIDSFLYVWDPDGQEILSDDDGGGSSNAMVRVPNAAHGRWTIYSTSVDAGQLGAYTLRVLRH
jgi:hypothetical protein